jgi:adenylate kinase
MKVIIITGSVGTGKTTLARKLAEKLNMNYLDVNKIIKKYNISEGYDKKRKTNIIDIKKLNKVLIKEIKEIKIIINSNKKINSELKKTLKSKNNKNKIENLNKKIVKGTIIDSHLSHYLPKSYVDLCIITKCELKVLEKRLMKRRYSKDKIRENLDAEIFDVCLNEAKENGHKVIVVNTTKGITGLNSINRFI